MGTVPRGRVNIGDKVFGAQPSMTKAAPASIFTGDNGGKPAWRRSDIAVARMCVGCGISAA
ncbi:MAG: hypothetical protein ACJAVR_003450 [Paracoccaceae bacterium]|jgi:hypothetical protein